MSNRCAHISRKTKETDIDLEFCLDGTGDISIDTGIGFFDHMLNSFARHGFFDLKLKVQGDLEVDCHHTEALKDKAGIKRYGYFILPMDETLALCAIDLSGRPYFVYDVDFTAERIGTFDTEMVKEFFYAVSYGAEMNLHLKKLDGSNNHHIAEAVFKAFAKALDEATCYDERIQGVLSTKGTL